MMRWEMTLCTGVAPTDLPSALSSLSTFRSSKCDGILGPFFTAAGSRHSPHSARITTDARTFAILWNRDATPTRLDDPEFSAKAKILESEGRNVRLDRNQETHGGLTMTTADRRRCEEIHIEIGWV